MKPYLFFTTTFIFILFFIQPSIAQTLSREAQIVSASSAAPDDLREGVSVYGYDQNGKFVLLKKGSNDLICLADDPEINGFSTACYHKDLEEFMARGRALKTEGKSPMEVFDIRESEVKSGKLKMPENPATLHVLYGPAARYDATSNSVVDALYRYVIYIPYATTESTGLPLKPRNPGDPWLMNPGTHRAHIMVTPAAN